MVRFKGFLLLLYTLVLSTSIRAQNYDLFYLDREMTYTIRNVAEEDSAFVFLSPDSSFTNALGEYFYFNRQLDTTGSFCPTIQSLVGDSLLVKTDENRTWVFFNSASDSIFIRSNLTDDEEWIFYTYPDGRYIKAKVVLHDNLTIMAGIDDSIFRVRLRVYASDGSELSDIFPDETKFDISKHFGITEIYNYNIFPEPSVLHYLRGISNPDTAITDVDAQSAHTFKSGYEFHYEEFLGNGDLDVHRLYKYFIQSIDVGADIASYTVQRTLWQETTGAGLTPDTLRILDTIDINYTFTDYAVLDTLELRYASDGFVSNGFNDFVRDTAFYNGVSHKWVYLYYGVDFTADTCMEIMFPPDPQPYFIYGQGLGIMLARDTNYYPVYPDDLELELFGRRLDMVYFQQGLITWGDPIDFSQYGFVGIQNPILATLNVYPNPATDRLYFDLPSEHIVGTIRISDLRGRNLLETPASASLDVANLQPGMYAWQLATPEVIYSGTFIKQ